MTQLAGLARFGLSSGRWLLPLVAILLVAASLTFAMNSAFGGGTSAMDQRPDVQFTESTSQATGAAGLERSTTSLSAASTDPARSIAADNCTALDSGAMHVGLDWWIVAEGQNIACESGQQ
jgi:hypothetical protein